MTDTTPPTVSAAEASDIRIVELPYHRLYRVQPGYVWWRPLLAVLLLVVFIVAAQLIIVVVVMVTLFATGAVALSGPADAAALETAVLSYFVPDVANPISLLIGLGSIAVWLPLVPLALRCAGIRPAGFRVNVANSVTFRLRWRWLAWCVLPAVIVLLLSFAVSVLVGLGSGERLGEFTTDPSTYALSVLLILLLVPLQSTAEEFVFRGVLFQAIGSWLRWVPVALIVTTVVFASLHIYDIWGLLDVASFAVAAILITWRTGGLESAIALHVVNNIIGLVTMGTGIFGPTGITAEGGSPTGLAITVVTMAVYVAIVLWFAKRAGIERTSRIGIPVAPGIPGAPAS